MSFSPRSASGFSLLVGSVHRTVNGSGLLAVTARTNTGCCGLGTIRPCISCIGVVACSVRRSPGRRSTLCHSRVARR